MSSSIGGRVRVERDAHPERYCRARNCNWALRSGPCPTHRVLDALVPEARVAAIGRYTMGVAPEPMLRARLAQEPVALPARPW
jgi:hypothetical protein